MAVEPQRRPAVDGMTNPQPHVRTRCRRVAHFWKRSLPHAHHACMMSVVSELGESRLLHLPQGAIRIYERGHGEPVVFVHGLFANAAAWRKVVPRLAGSY